MRILLAAIIVVMVPVTLIAQEPTPLEVAPGRALDVPPKPFALETSSLLIGPPPPAVARTFTARESGVARTLAVR